MGRWSGGEGVTPTDLTGEFFVVFFRDFNFSRNKPFGTPQVLRLETTLDTSSVQQPAAAVQLY